MIFGTNNTATTLNSRPDQTGHCANRGGFRHSPTSPLFVAAVVTFQAMTGDMELLTFDQRLEKRLVVSGC
jgi:hypothetical protein